MIRIITALLLISTGVNSQLLKIALIINDGGASGTDTLFFGVDPEATDGIDTILGEYQLPPVPPTGIFDCRFVGNDIEPPLPIGQGLNRDYRQGNESLNGSKLHEIKFQKGSGNLIDIHWSLPNGVSGRLYDLLGGVVVNDSMHGNGSITIVNNAIEKLFMRINYALGSIGIKSICGRIPDYFGLFQNFPNPFNPNTRIRFAVAKQDFIELNIYDVMGKTIAILVNNNLKPGVYEVEWNAEEFSSGIYFYKLMSDKYLETKKMILLK